MGRIAYDKVKAEILDLLDKKGGPIGNYTLIAQLKCSEDTYWRVRDQLIDAGEVIIWKGRGGSLKLAELESAEVPEKKTKTKTKKQKVKEATLYGTVQQVLRDKWAPAEKLHEAVVEITAHQGSKDTGGKWTRPDLIVVSVSSYSFVPGKFIDVTTFEVKNASDADISSVFEALAHRRFGTRAILLLNNDIENREELDEAMGPIVESCSKHGIGLIIAETLEEYATWDIQLRPDRVQPDPQRLNELIAGQLKEPADKEKIMRWCR